MKVNLQTNCYCGNERSFENCCEAFLTGKKSPESAVVLMRSRFTAYVLANADYIINTTHPKKRYLHKKKDILEWARESEWLQLEVLEAAEYQVVFKAHYRDGNQSIHTHFERSQFEKVAEKWFYISGTFD